MSAPLQILLAFGSVGVLIGVMAAVRALARRMSVPAEVQRKLIHVATGLYAIGLPWLFADDWPVYLLLGITLVVMAVLRMRRISGSLGDTLHGVDRTSYGDVMLALSVGLCFFLSDGQALLYVLPLAVLTLADAAAALAGTTYGTRRFAVEDGHKSVEGSVVFFIVTLLIAMICLLFLADLPPAHLLVLAVLVAGFGTLVEAQSWRGFDNLFLPLGLYVLLEAHLDAPLATLLWVAGGFLAAILGFQALARRLGLRPMTARVYVVALFLILVSSELQNALLPAALLVLHGVAHRQAPSQDRHGELDVVAALALVSFGWMALGLAVGWNALSFYGLTVMGMAMGLAGLLRPYWIPVVALGLFALRHGAMGINPLPVSWSEPMWLLPALCLLWPAGLVALRPAWVTRHRMAKLTCAALILPLAGYALGVQQAPYLEILQIKALS